jgi:hypothetical protein
MCAGEFGLKWRENTALNPRHKTLTNQNVPFSFTWIKGPTSASIIQVTNIWPITHKHKDQRTHKQHLTASKMIGPHRTDVRAHIPVTQAKTVARGGGQGSAEPLVWPNCHKALTPPASTYRLLVNSRRWCCMNPQDCRPRTPSFTSINMRGGAPK